MGVVVVWLHHTTTNSISSTIPQRTHFRTLHTTSRGRRICKIKLRVNEKQQLMERVPC
jgi:hypothetical protein